MGLNLKENPDFAGWATVYNVKCSDGRTLKPNSFKDCDGIKVPIVYNHDHQDINGVLGHAYLENRADRGVYAYCYLNDTENGQAAKEMVKHGDISALSIYANKLKEQAGNVYHGMIREVSLVLASANPKAHIDTVLTHADPETDEWEAEMYFGEPINTNIELEHSDESSDEEDGALQHAEESKQEEKKMAAPEEKKEESGKTIGEVFDEFTPEQKDVVYAIVGQAVEEALANNDKDEEGEDEDMKHNAFDNYDEQQEEVHVLSHSDVEEIFRDAKSCGSLRQAVLAHTDDYGIENIDYLFPDAKLNADDPQFIRRKDDWVSKVMSGVGHNPFSRIRSIFADITEDDARAKGYIKGNYKKEEVFRLLKRKTEPTTVYKKQKFDRDDIIDITDFDVIAMVKKEMRWMYNEEVARAILVGDGRPASSEDHIDETHIRPIWKEEDLFTVRKDVAVAANATADVKAKTFIRTAIKARKDYKGSGNPVLFTTEDLLTDMLLLEDGIGHPLYDTEEKLRTALRVSEIITVPVMEGLSRTTDKGETKNLLGIIVNLSDYKVGTDKMGQLTMFDDFDIDYNKMIYLMEGRMSGCLVKPFSAIVLEESISVTLSINPTSPNETRYGKEVDDLQSNIEINSDSIMGTLRYVTGYTGFSGDPAEQSGNFLSLDLSATPADAVIQAEIIGGNSEGNPVTVDDGQLVIRVADRKQKLHIKVTSDANVIEKTYRFGSLKLKTASN